MKYSVYKFINRYDEVIYIGKSKDLDKRMSNHNHLDDECYKEMAYITYTTFGTEHEMDFAERYYIQKENPKYNTMLSGRRISFNCEELDNAKFIPYEINGYVVEKTLEQINSLMKESIEIQLDANIYEFAGIIFMLKVKKQGSLCGDSREKYKEIRSRTIDIVLDKFNKLSSKYNLIDMSIKYNLGNNDENDISKGFNFESKTVSFKIEIIAMFGNDNIKEKNMIAMFK